jgi:hypothetical protein
MYGVRTKASVLLLAITVLAGCATTTKPPNPEKQHMDLDDAFRARGMQLDENGELADLQGHCSSLVSGTQEWRTCVADKIFDPVHNFEEVLTNLTAVKLVRALPNDADLSDLPTQMNLIRQGQYKTWSGELRPFPPEETAGAPVTTETHQAFKSSMPDSNSERVSLSIETTKTIFK